MRRVPLFLRWATSRIASNTQKPAYRPAGEQPIGFGDHVRAIAVIRVSGYGIGEIGRSHRVIEPLLPLIAMSWTWITPSWPAKFGPAFA